MLNSVNDYLSKTGINLERLNAQMILETVVLVVICLVLIKIILKIVDKVLDRARIDKTLHGFIHGLTKYALLFVTIILAAQSMGVNMTSLIALFSVVGLAVSLSVQGALANFAGGVILLVSRPFNVGDYVIVNGAEGTVKRIGLIHTQVMTPDKKMIFVPNSKISEGEIKNYTSEDTTKVELKVSASYESPIDLVHKALLDACESVPEIYSDPEPFINVAEYGDSNIVYLVRAETEGDNATYWRAYFALLEAVKKSFDKFGVEISYDKIDVKIIGDRSRES